MKSTVKMYIDKVIQVGENDSEAYHEIVSQTPPIMPLFLALVEKYGFSFKTCYPEGLAQYELSINLGEFKKGAFEIDYRYFLTFSKLGPFFKDEFQVYIDHPDPDAITGGEICDTNSTGYTITHCKFHDDLLLLLKKEGFVLLDFRDLTEVISGLEFIHESMKFFGEQPNVEMLLFNNFFDPD